MTYREVMAATHGKQFVHIHSGRMVTRTEWYFLTPISEQESFLNFGYSTAWRMEDKRGWRDGAIEDMALAMLN